MNLKKWRNITICCCKKQVKKPVKETPGQNFVLFHSCLLPSTSLNRKSISICASAVSLVLTDRMNKWNHRKHVHLSLNTGKLQSFFYELLIFCQGICAQTCNSLLDCESEEFEFFWISEDYRNSRRMVLLSVFSSLRVCTAKIL